MVDGKIRILFVDDEPGVLDGLRRLFRKKREIWDCHFAISGENALREFEAEPYDVVVTDMRMPRMDGAELLHQISQRWPDTIRFVLSGQSERESVDRTMVSTHQFLSKPCEAAELHDRLERAIFLRQLCNQPQLRELVSRLGSLPSIPDAYLKIREVLQSQDCSLASVAEVVKTDMAMSAKLLQLVNSSFFSVRARVVEVERAVALLGVDIIQSLALTLGIFRAIQKDPRCANFPVEQFWTHCMNCGTLARRIATDLDLEKPIVSTTMVAGLLHDLGVLIRLSQQPVQFEQLHQRALMQKCRLYDVEMEQDQISHAELGAYLLGLWGLPMTVVDAVLLHHAPEQILSREPDAVLPVYLANILLQEHHPRSSGNGAVPELNAQLIHQFHLESKLPHWRKMVSDDANPNSQPGKIKPK